MVLCYFCGSRSASARGGVATFFSRKRVVITNSAPYKYSLNNEKPHQGCGSVFGGEVYAAHSSARALRAAGLWPSCATSEGCLASRGFRSQVA